MNVRLSIARASGLAAVLMFCACSVGIGEGEVSGELFAPACGVVGPYSLRPNFFVADPIEEKLQIRVQRGGDYDFYSDGILISVVDAAEVVERLGEPIVLDGARDALVTMNFFAQDTCLVNSDDVPVNYLAVEGAVTFYSIYAPDVDSQRLISARFDDVRFVDPADPETRYATLSGHFEFLFNRGRPAQRFP